MAAEPEIKELNYHSDTDEEFHGFGDNYGNMGCQVSGNMDWQVSKEGIQKIHSKFNYLSKYMKEFIQVKNPFLADVARKNSDSCIFLQDV